MSFHPSAPRGAFLHVFFLPFPFFLLFLFSINCYTSASCVRERVDIVENGCTLGPPSYPSSLGPNHRLSGPGKRTDRTRSSQRRLRHLGPIHTTRSRSRRGWLLIPHANHHLGRARLTSASPPPGSERTPLGGGALPVGCHTGTIVWTELCRRLRGLPRRYLSLPHTHGSPVGGKTIHSGERPFIGSSLACILHSFTSRGVNAFIAHPACSWGSTRL